MAGALDGVRVIDFGQYVAGPMAGMLLADQGADVVRVDPPGGPRWDTAANAVWNRGKRSIVLDLKQAEDLAIARRLVEGADVVIENFRPGVMERLGLGAEAMTAANARLIYCSMPGFASDDPRAEMPGWEGVIAAATATYRTPRGSSTPGRPVYTAIPIASCYAAIQSVVSIAVALSARERDGVGQRIEVPLFDGMFAPMGGRATIIHNDHPPQPTAGGTWGGPFLCKDGRWIYFSASGNSNFREFIEAAGVTSWDAEGLTDRDRLAREPELAAEQGRRIVELFKTRTAQDWEDLIALAGSEGAVVRSTAEWLDHPHARESQMIVEVDDPTLGKTLQPGVNPRLSVTPGAIRGPAPRLNAQREELLAEVDARPSVAAGGAVESTLRAALDGVRVLDLCIILAGPTAGRTLAEFGADVIKIDDPNRGATVSYHNEVNRGKRTILLDLRTPAGLDVFWRLLEDTDVVVQNYRAGRVDALGIGYDEVRKRRPDIVYGSLNAYGHEGPWTPRPGHEQFAQAATGMQQRFGGDGRPLVQPYPINDFGTGFLGAYGIALALLHRQRTGEGQHVDTSLAYTACTLQSVFLPGYDGKQWDEPRGQTALGSGPLHRSYEASDGWFFLAARDAERPRLAAVDGLSATAGLDGAELERALEHALAAQSVDTWVRRLTAAGLAAHRVVHDMDELTLDPWVQAHGLALTRDHDDLGSVTTTGPTPRLSRTPVQPGQPAPRPGSDAAAILAEVGLGDRLDDLVSQGVVRTEGVEARRMAAQRY